MSITLCHLMEQIHPKTWNSLETYLLSNLLILGLPNVSKNYMVEQDKINYLHNKKEVLVIVAWKNIVLAHGAVTA